MYYTATGVLAIIILLIVNHDIFLNLSDDFRKPAWKVYRRFLFAVLIYYVTDVLWGEMESRKLARLLFADTTVYFIAMAAGVLSAAKKAEAGDELGAKRVITISRLVRYLLLFGILLAVVLSKRFELPEMIAMLIPLVLFRPILSLGELFRKKEGGEAKT